MKTTEKDKQILHDLAKQYMEICEGQQESRKLWHDFNSLKTVRPPVYCMVFFATHMEEELAAAIPPCETEEHLHEVEYWLRSRLWAAGIPERWRGGFSRHRRRVASWRASNCSLPGPCTAVCWRRMAWPSGGGRQRPTGGRRKHDIDGRENAGLKR